jgi:hypothetical protein
MAVAPPQGCLAEVTVHVHEGFFLPDFAHFLTQLHDRCQF